MKNILNANKIARLILGSVMVGTGVAVCINTGLGADPLSVLWQGISIKLGITLGQAGILTGAIFIILILLLDPHQIHIGSIVYQIVQSVTNDTISPYLHPTNYTIINILLLLLGLFLIGTGIGIYSSADVGKGPYEGIVFGINKRFGISIAGIRISCDIIFMLAGILLGGPITIGPIIAILSIGIIVQKTVNIIKKCELNNC